MPPARGPFSLTFGGYMSLLDLLDVADMLVHWRFFVGIGITALLCGLVVLAAPGATLAWAICVPLCLAGLFLSFRWQSQAGD
ncbi:hypothetical protein D3C71_912170 [compost metagenome]